MSFTLPSLPAGFESQFKVSAAYTAPVRRPVEPVGRYFLAHATRSMRGHTWSEFEKIEAETNVKVVEEAIDEDDFDVEQSAELLSHDPRNWKTADLYAVLGLSKYRHLATEAQIIKAHRKQVLMHHPDKKSAAGGTLEQDGFFKIIQKAFETIMDSNKRQQFDSVDKAADLLPPSAKSTYDFFTAWAPVFASEARFSKKQPVPELGTLEDDKKTVDAFYNFWNNFDSWRTFEFLDDDVPDDSANRDHKRYIERKNIAARKKHKVEDNRRLIALIQRAQSEDPRIKNFKDAEKAEKAARKWEREAGARKAAEEAAAAKAAAEAAAAEAEAAAKIAKEGGKKAKEAAKAAKKKNKRAVRASAKDSEYFGAAADSESIDAEIDIMIDSFDDATLGEVASKVTGASADTVKTTLQGIAAKLVSEGKVAASSLKFFSA
ncbi:hypothetical protein BABINDRAFT_48239 [Babjeviella inositovora NRRL Y-12698]|uniref:J domain-containing protein n=1 Tax=Babjeviella inositovora NRRL Y-12698 TaxID=984486 RepID=A0A1E3QV00_9ASCO|nr:uncharacterized protein BABINDRAFT_48239 [Babjeviella inositovora NRRL Y-12698]ODQ80872.1 hypothetical protein BABINDRAFT_48239 [Babjeviella inositovora NRRL Y-12698]